MNNEKLKRKMVKGEEVKIGKKIEEEEKEEEVKNTQIR